MRICFFLFQPTFGLSEIKKKQWKKKYSPHPLPKTSYVQLNIPLHNNNPLPLL